MEPKSVHTYLESQAADVCAYDVDVRITDFPVSPNREWLYFFALQVNFAHHEEWAHGGFQWSGTHEFKGNNKGVNWGGGSDWAGYGGIGVNNTPFIWERDRWYRYRVWRVDKDAEGYHRWIFAVMDYAANVENQFGTVRTKSQSIAGAMVFTETGYGVQCDSPTARVEWRSPCLHSLNGQSTPHRIIANYNGTCSNPSNTNQGSLSSSPIIWFHETNAKRLVNPDTCIWAKSAG
tara:strand:- start:25568 stop:26269 length:702 start_codon:yes stop_codon:yes gene_type:complete